MRQRMVGGIRFIEVPGIPEDVALLVGYGQAGERILAALEAMSRGLPVPASVWWEIEQAAAERRIAAIVNLDDSVVH